MDNDIFAAKLPVKKREKKHFHDSGNVSTIQWICQSFAIAAVEPLSILNKYAIYAYTHGPVTGSALSPH